MGRVVLIVGGVTLIAIVSASVIPGRRATPQTSPPTGADVARPAAGAFVAQLPATGRRGATLAVVTGAATVTVTAAAMPGSMMRVWTPGDSAIRPQLVPSAGRARLLFLSTGQRGPSAVAVQLSTAVTWQLQFTGGTNQTVLNLSNGKVASIDFTAGSSLIQMVLPRPAGTATITLAGGAGQVSLTVPSGVPTRLRLYGGATTATLPGRTRAALPRGAVLSTPGWAHAASRYDVDAPAGVGDISVVG